MKKFEYTAVPVKAEQIAKISVYWKKFRIAEMSNIIAKYCSAEEMELTENLRSWNEGDLGKVVKTDKGTLFFEKTSTGVDVFLTKEEGFLTEVFEDFDWDEYENTHPERDLKYKGDEIDLPKLFDKFGASDIDSLLSSINNTIDWYIERMADGFDEQDEIFCLKSLTSDIQECKDYLIKKYNL